MWQIHEANRFKPKNYHPRNFQLVLYEGVRKGGPDIGNILCIKGLLVQKAICYKATGSLSLTPGQVFQIIWLYNFTGRKKKNKTNCTKIQLDEDQKLKDIHQKTK